MVGFCVCVHIHGANGARVKETVEIKETKHGDGNQREGFNEERGGGGGEMKHNHLNHKLLSVSSRLRGERRKKRESRRIEFAGVCVCV